MRSHFIHTPASIFKLFAIQGNGSLAFPDVKANDKRLGCVFIPVLVAMGDKDRSPHRPCETCWLLSPEVPSQRRLRVGVFGSPVRWPLPLVSGQLSPCRSFR